MAKIIISELQYSDSESFLSDLNDQDLMVVYGGDYYALSQMLNFGIKFLEFGLIVFAIYSIVELLQLFNNDHNAYF
jgi:hypothetical protein